MNQEILRNYLGLIELAMKQRVGVVPEQVLYEFQAEIAREIADRGEQGSGVDEHWLTNRFGTPNEIANARGFDPQTRDSGNAPGWRICCTVCGRSSPASAVGITRRGARSWHKYTAGNCQTCGRITPCRLLRDLDQITLTKHILDGKTPDQIRSQQHHPWIIVAAILIMVVVINLCVIWLASLR